MSKQDILTNIQAINEGLQTGRLMEVLETYYADDVVMQENAKHDPERIGKANNRKAEQAFVDHAVIHEARVDKVVVDGDGVGDDAGTWTLTVTDTFPSDGGTWNTWCMNIKGGPLP